MVWTQEKTIEVVLWVLYFIGLYLIFFWLSIFFSSEYKWRRDKMPKLLKNENLPNVTVIVPVYNEVRTLQRTLDSLFAVDYDWKKVRVVCVNDGSTDGSLGILKSLQKKYDFEVLDQKNQGKHNAINNVLKTVNTPYFLCLDADSYPQKESLRILVSEIVRSKVAAVSPLMFVHKPSKFVVRLQWVEYIFSVFFKYLASMVDSMMVLSGPFSIYRTDVIKKVGGFRDGYRTEDFELALRLQKEGYDMEVSRFAKVETKTPESFKSLLNQRVRWILGNFLCMKDYFRFFFFNKKFADFGVFVFPTMFLSGFMLLFAFGLIIYLTTKSVIDKIHNFALVNFDVMTYIKNYEFDFSFLSLDYRMLFLLGFSLFLLVMIFYISSRELGLKFTPRNFVSGFFAFLFFAFIYRFLLLWVYLRVIKRLIFRTKLTWMR